MSKYNAHSEPLFKRLGLLTITDMLKHNALKFYYKLKNKRVPAYFKNFRILTQEEIHGRNTRHNQLISLNVPRTNLQQRCLRNYLPEVLNSTPSNITDKVSTHIYKAFSEYAKLKFVEIYSSTCNIQNCYVCNS